MYSPNFRYAWQLSRLALSAIKAIHRFYARFVPCELPLSISLILPFCAVLISPAQETLKPRQLIRGKPIERELAGDQSHSYQITLTAGECFKVIVDQRGIDVMAKLFGPDGVLLADFDFEPRTQGEEAVEWMAESAGGYRLDVVMRYKDAAAGRYQIEMTELRLAKDDDRALSEARKSTTEFRRLFNAAKFSEAQPLGERILKIQETVLGPEHPLVARSSNNFGLAYFYAGDYAKAEPFIPDSGRHSRLRTRETAV
jgi:tetratricopeptide repeat protein